VYRISDLVPSRWRTAAEVAQTIEAAAAESPRSSAWIEDNGTVIEPDWLVLSGPQPMHAWAADWLAELRTGEQTQRERERRELDRALTQPAERAPIQP
jgi:hypothetical protein